ncbi:hypothetical protein Tco_1254884 [Tanacetum coccineum]
MSNMSKDIQYAGSDTRPPMLDRTDFESWQQRIRLYCLEKVMERELMKSINEGNFKNQHEVLANKKQNDDGGFGEGKDISKITRKQSKNKQTRTREPEEYKAEARKAKPQSKSAKKNQSQSKMVNKSQQSPNP